MGDGQKVKKVKLSVFGRLHWPLQSALEKNWQLLQGLRSRGNRDSWRSRWTNKGEAMLQGWGQWQSETDMLEQRELADDQNTE